MQEKTNYATFITRSINKINSPDRVPDLLIKLTHQIKYGHFLFFRGGDRLQKATMRQLDKDRGEERHHLCPRIL